MRTGRPSQPTGAAALTHRRPPALKAELITAVQRLFPGCAEGLVLCVHFRRRRFRREAVTVSSVWAPGNGDGGRCIWSRSQQPRRPGTGRWSIPRPILWRLARTVARLESGGAFCCGDDSGWVDGDGWWHWIDPEPDAYPGLDRLVITVIPRR
ncbi:hypothetical protein AGRA3207_007545 [Actinomadura graeca]|uniref:Uncharacterized protein n=1 Tax=Actinomadura graeca TaxID=2750812 RepID=A0ABX8RAG6_9ACTN|nr:hypothetical protein [Actinomadura graeca]QXJ25973.1 hypothetical protein AGRA3207_007545 [Actinomadura graeca]